MGVLRMTALASAMLVATAVSTLLAALLSSLAGTLQTWIAATSLAAGAVAGLLATRAGAGLEEERRPRPWEALALAVLGIAALRQFLWLAYEHDGRLLSLDPMNYGDLPLHWTYIHYLAGGAPFWPENPIFTGQRLQYPFGMDLFAALFVKLGLGTAGVLVLTGAAASALLAAGLRRWGGAFAVAAFVLSGGFGAEPQWKNLLLALFVPQRGFLFALPAGLLLLWSWRERLLRERGGLRPWIEGVLWGALPLFHLHSFLLVSLVYALWSLPRLRQRATWAPLLWALAPATWGVVELSDRFRAASFAGWHLGWMIGGANPVPFLLRNFGVLLLLVSWAAIVAPRSATRDQRLTLLPGLGIFVALFFVKVAPWAWDNTKLMVWGFLLTLPACDELVLRRLPVLARAGALALLLAPGAWTVADATFHGRHGYELLQIAETEAVCHALDPLAARARVATAQTFNHPVALCGHPLVAGYAGHLWSHGIQGAEVMRRLSALMMGVPGWEESARVLGARYLFWGRREEREFPASLRPWEGTKPLVASGPWGRLYDLGS